MRFPIPQHIKDVERAITRCVVFENGVTDASGDAEIRVNAL